MMVVLLVRLTNTVPSISSRKYHTCQGWEAEECFWWFLLHAWCAQVKMIKWFEQHRYFLKYMVPYAENLNNTKVPLQSIIFSHPAGYWKINSKNNFKSKFFLFFFLGECILSFYFSILNFNNIQLSGCLHVINSTQRLS